MASLDVPQLVHELALGAEEMRWVNYTLVPGIALMVFDWLLTLDLEVSLIWSAPRSPTKLLFLLTRYLPFLDVSVTMYYQFGYALPKHVCKISYEFLAWMFVIGQCFAVAILTTRTWAVWGKGKGSTYGLFGVFGTSVVAFLTLIGLYLRSSTFEASPVPRLIGCVTTAHNSSYLATIYVMLMFYDGGLLLLMIAQGVSALRTAGKSQLTRVVYRDGILYYIYIFGLSLVNTIVIFRLHDAYKTMLVPIERVTYSILACRVVLHIREQGEKEKQLLLPSEQMTGPLRFAQATQKTGPIVTDISEETEGGP